MLSPQAVFSEASPGSCTDGSGLGMCSALGASQNQHAQATSGSGLWFLGPGQRCSPAQNRLGLLPDHDANPCACLCPLPDPMTAWSVAPCQLASIRDEIGDVGQGECSCRCWEHPGMCRWAETLSASCAPPKKHLCSLMGSSFLPCFTANMPFIFGWVLD